MGIFQNIKKSLGGFINRKSYYALFYDDRLDSAVKWGPTDFLRANELSLYLNRAIAKRAEKVGQIEFFITKGDTVLDSNPFLDILSKPNPYQTGRQFWSLYQTYLDLTGSAFIFIERDTAGDRILNRPIKSLSLLRPDLVKIKYNEDETAILGYSYSKGGTVVEYIPEQVIYSYRPNPFYPLRGMSLVQSGIMAIDTGVQIEQYQSKIIRNGGKVEGVFKFKTPMLTQDQLDNLKDDYAQQMADAKNSGKPLFLGGDTDYQRLGLNPEELSYIATKGVILDDICMLTGVPRAILANVTDVKFANADASVAVFLRETIKPLLEALTELLDWRFIPKDLELGFVDPTPEDTDMKLKIAESGIKNYYLTPNEAREIMDFEPIEGGDELLVPFSVVAQSTGDTTPTDTGTGKAIKKVHFLKDPVQRKLYADIVVKRMDKDEANFKKAISSYFKGQHGRIVSHLKSLKGRSKASLDGFSLDLEVDIAKDDFLPLIKDILIKSGKATAQVIGGTFVFSSTLEAWVDKRAGLFAEEINKTTFKKLTDLIAENATGGATRDETIKDIGKLYDGFTKTRSITIARTEVHSATNNGNFEAYKQAGFDTKIWVAVMDDATRDSHAMLDGEEVPINQHFSNGLMYAGDPSGSPEEIINCRCVS